MCLVNSLNIGISFQTHDLGICVSRGTCDSSLYWLKYIPGHHYTTHDSHDKHQSYSSRAFGCVLTQWRNCPKSVLVYIYLITCTDADVQHCLLWNIPDKARPRTSITHRQGTLFLCRKSNPGFRCDKQTPSPLGHPTPHGELVHHYKGQDYILHNSLQYTNVGSVIKFLYSQ